MEETQVAGDPWRMRRAFVFEKIMMIPVWIGVCVLLVETQSWRNCNERYKNNNIIRYTVKTLRHIYSIPIHEDSPKPSSFVMIIDELAYYHFFFASCRHLEERLP